MVQIFKHSSEYDYSFQTVTSAYFRKYSMPSPYTTHVATCDVVRCDLTNNGNLLVERLSYKVGSLPKIFRFLLGNITGCWILETALVDPRKRSMQTWTRNVDHRSIIRVDDVASFIESGSRTRAEHRVKFRSTLRLGLRDKIERMSKQVFPTHHAHYREALEFVMARLTTLSM